MAISLGDTYSLGQLGLATGDYTAPLAAGSNVSLGTIKGSPTAGDNIYLGADFRIDSVDSISGYTYAVENTSETYTLGFTGAGSRFSEISSQAANFTWSVAAGSKISLSANNGSSATFAVGDMTNAPTQTTLQSVLSHTLRVVFADGFNQHASNYGANRDKTVYSVDSYDGNSTALCLASNTLITLADETSIELGDLEEGMKLKGMSLEGLAGINMMDYSVEGSVSPTKTEVEVLNLVFSFADRVYNINEGQIVASAEHPLLVKSEGIISFKEIHKLQVGDFLIREDGGEVEITSFEVVDETTEIVSLDVSGPDTYVANGYITHNKGANTHTDLGNPGAPTSLTYTVVNDTNKNITWAAGTSSGTTGVTGYDIQVDNNSDFSSPIFDFTEYSSTTLNVVALATGTYYVRVRAIDHGLKSTWASTSFAHTQGPNF